MRYELKLTKFQRLSESRLGVILENSKGGSYRPPQGGIGLIKEVICLFMIARWKDLLISALHQFTQIWECLIFPSHSLTIFLFLYEVIKWGNPFSRNARIIYIDSVHFCRALFLTQSCIYLDVLWLHSTLARNPIICDLAQCCKI